MSRMMGVPSGTGMPAAIGLAERRRWVPPKGATRMPPPLVLTKWSEILPALAAISAQSPIRPRWPEFRSADHAHALAPGLGDAQLHRLFAHHLTEAELPVNDRDRVVLEYDLQTLVRQNLGRTKPFDIGRDTDHSVRVVPHEVGLDQVMSDAPVLRRGAAGGCKDAIDEELEPVM